MELKCDCCGREEREPYDVGDECYCEDGRFQLLKTGLWRIIKERYEQLGKHGFDAGHDDENSRAELAQAAAYLISEGSPAIPNNLFAGFPDTWTKSWKERFDRKSDIEKLTIAGALIAAEIDRRLRKGC